MERRRPAKRRVRQPDPAVFGRNARLERQRPGEVGRLRSLTEKLLKKSTLEQMWTPTKTSKGGTADYGFGWQVDKVNGHRLIAHGGGIPGFSTQISRFPDDKLTVIVLTNSGNGSAGALAQGIAGRILPVLLKKAEEPIADNDPQATERFKGLLLRAMKGEADPELFTEEAKKALVPRIKEGKAHVCPVRRTEVVSAPGAEDDRSRHAVYDIAPSSSNETLITTVRPRQGGQDRGVGASAGGVMSARGLSSGWRSADSN